MFDLASIINDINTIIRNASGQGDNTIRMKGAYNALLESDKIFRVLRDAKDVHDGFECFMLSAMERLYSAANRNKVIDVKEIANIVGGSFGYCSRKFLPSVDNFLPGVSITETDIEELKKSQVDTSIKIVLEEIFNIKKLMPEFRKHEQDINSFVAIKNFGDHFDVSVKAAYDRTKLITEAADKIIVHSVPMIIRIQEDVRNLIRP